MGREYFTMQEIQTLRFYELPTRIYEAIMTELENVLCGGHELSQRLKEIVNHAIVMDLDQYVDIYRFVRIIG